MAKNDRIILDQLIEDAAMTRSVPNDGEFFESFVLEQLLKDIDLSVDEIALGNVDGRDDGGIDAWYTVLDGELIVDGSDIPDRKSAGSISIHIFTCKHHDTFKQDAVVAIASSLRELLDLTTDESEMSDRYNEAVLSARETFQQVLLKTVKFNPRIEFQVSYVSRGDSSSVGESIEARSNVLVRDLNNLFSNCSTFFRYIGSAELLQACRKLKDFSAVLKFEEGPISRGPGDYLGLAKLTEYFKLATSEDGELRRYLFESNVRDYMGHTFVNVSIERTLDARLASNEEDFWWLNNGVTLLAQRANVVGKELHLENVQIVNGLQTTEAIYKHVASESDLIDDRAVLVKVLVTNDKALSDRIILATNNQNKVDPSSLRATDKIQRDIEDVLLSRGWFYDRRRNYHVNQGRPRNRIVSIPFMAWATLSVRLREAHACNRSRPKYMQSDTAYHRIFDERASVNVFLAVLELCKAVEREMHSRRMKVTPYSSRNYATVYRFQYAMCYVARKSMKRHCSDQEIIAMGNEELDFNVLDEVHNIIKECRSEFLKQNKTARKLHRHKPFAELLLVRMLDTCEPGVS
ncbi:AIPR family protein [Bremerella sp. JC770]|uniref:AIPR family protein n=1 Tax=Bremerella sp. JC770 TaxID=3232137 RepID=UPI00345B0241